MVITTKVWQRLTGTPKQWEPDPDTGLPSARALMTFPALVMAAVFVLTALAISGTSTGMWWILIHGDVPDPNLLYGQPRAIASDMWLVQDSWIRSQAAQGFPGINQTLPGGMDSTIQNELPAWEWSTLFRPHLWLYLVAPLAQGAAWRWLLPGALVVIGTHLFVTTMAPRRPWLASMLSIFVLYQPLVQWWFRPMTLLPLAWCLFTLAAVRWLIRSRRLDRIGLILAVLAGYLAVSAAMTIYVPYLVPAALGVAFFTVGEYLNVRRGCGWRAALQRLVPLLAAAGVAIVTLMLWLYSRRSTIDAVMSTVYPGRRRTAAGECQAADSCAATFSTAWNGGLQSNIIGGLGPNTVEASSVIHLELYLLPALLVLVYTSVRRRTLDWQALMAAGLSTTLLTFILVPGWDFIARFLALDLSVSTRLRIGLLIAGIIAAAVLLERLDDGIVSARTRIAMIVLTALTALGVQGGIWLSLRATADEVLVQGWTGKALILLIAAGVTLLAHRHATVGAAILVAVSLNLSAGVNPIYRGWSDLASTPIGLAVREVNTQAPGSWVGIIDPSDGVDLRQASIPTGILLASGVQAYNGVQTYPPELMWSQIDPAGKFENEWNRLANVYWVPGTGEPNVTNSHRDQIEVTFDSCSEFAKEHVAHVLSIKEIQQPCLTLNKQVTEGQTTAWIYDVTPKKS